MARRKAEPESYMTETGSMAFGVRPKVRVLIPTHYRAGRLVRQHTRMMTREQARKFQMERDYWRGRGGWSEPLDNMPYSGRSRNPDLKTEGDVIYFTDSNGRVNTRRR